MPRKLKLLYIAGSTRSGSTILEKILGQIDGFFSSGELYRNIWDRGSENGYLCGCGVPAQDCPHWAEVLDVAYGGLEKVDTEEMIRANEKMRTRYIPLMLTPLAKPFVTASAPYYTSNLERLYRAIQSVTGSKVVIDSSKVPSYGRMLETIPEVELYIVHLVRDARAVAYSWTRKKARLSVSGVAYMERHSSVVSSLLWNLWNLASETFRMHRCQRYLRIRYEDFIERPQETVRLILDFVQEKAPHLPFVSDHEVVLKATHTLGGNPARFQGGTVALRLDREWRVRMRRSDKAIVTALTWPLLIRYGYMQRKPPAEQVSTA